MKIDQHFFIKNRISIQDTDGSYFESFTSLSWKRDNRRLSAIRQAESRAEVLQQNDCDQFIDEEKMRADQKEQLYIEVLYTIANTVGAPAPDGQVNF